MIEINLNLLYSVKIINSIETLHVRYNVLFEKIIKKSLEVNILIFKLIYLSTFNFSLEMLKVYFSSTYCLVIFLLFCFTARLILPIWKKIVAGIYGFASPGIVYSFYTFRYYSITFLKIMLAIKAYRTLTLTFFWSFMLFLYLLSIHS